MLGRAVSVGLQTVVLYTLILVDSPVRRSQAMVCSRSDIVERCCPTTYASEVLINPLSEDQLFLSCQNGVRPRTVTRMFFKAPSRTSVLMN